MDPEDWAGQIADRLTNGNKFFPGCGAHFQWWFGYNAVCPKCGTNYLGMVDCIARYRIEK